MNYRNNGVFVALFLLVHSFIFSLLSFAGVGEAISISADIANSTPAGLGTSVSNLLIDSFAYDPVNPTSTSPVRNWNTSDLTLAYHALEAEGDDVTLSFVLDTPFTNRFDFLEVVVDIWGRNDCCQKRDDDVDIILYNGDYSTVVASVEGVAVPDAAPQHLRVTFYDLFEGVVFDRFQIIGHDSYADANNNFTLFEIRLAFVSPYTWTGEAGDCDWTNTLNWLTGKVPVDGAPGTDYDSGLNIYYKDYIAFAGDNLPTNNFPGIGGNYPDYGDDSPSMILKSGGAAAFNVVARDSGFWVNTLTDRTVIEVGDGIGGGSEDVELTLGGVATIDLNRHVGEVTQSILINSDGFLTFNSNLMFSYNNTRNGTLVINGGGVDVNGTLSNIKAIDGNYVEFTSTNGTFTANFGGDYSVLSVVRDRLEKDFVVGPEIGNYHLIATDNGDSTFTVTPGVYCWTGAANDGDWNNTANWIEGRIPVDNAPGTGSLDGLTVDFNEFIVFDGANMPTVNVPQFGGDHKSLVTMPEKDTPTLRLKRGGTLTMSVTGTDDGFWTNTQVNRTVLVVGDGVCGGIEDVTLIVTNMTGSLNRHYGGITHTLEVNADGTLIIAGEADFVFNENTDRWTKMVLNGGTVIVQGVLDDLLLHDNNRIEFNALESNITAQYGGDFADLASVKSNLGVEFIDNVESDEMRLAAVNNGDGTYTVMYEPVPPPGTTILIQ